MGGKDEFADIWAIWNRIFADREAYDMFLDLVNLDNLLHRMDLADMEETQDIWCD